MSREEVLDQKRSFAKELFLRGFGKIKNHEIEVFKVEKDRIIFKYYEILEVRRIEDVQM